MTPMEEALSKLTSLHTEAIRELHKSVKILAEYIIDLEDRIEALENRQMLGMPSIN